MKKIVSLVAATALAVTMFVFGATTAMAVPSPTAPTTQPTTAPTTQPTTAVTTTQPSGHDHFFVNGEQSTDVTYTPGSDKNEITFGYTGDGTLDGWETNLDKLGLVEGVDYTITENPDGTITIKFISEKAIALWDSNKVDINALVSDEEPEEDETTTKKNESSKSPNTGISTTAIAGTVAVLGAGVAVLAATKKKDAE